jgi:hypothetical protein
MADTIEIGATKRCRSSLSNASKLLFGIDGRTAPARRYRDVLSNLVLDYVLSGEADLSLARSLAVQLVWLEDETAKRARGEPVNDVMLTRASNAIRRLKRDLERSTKARIRKAKS